MYIFLHALSVGTGIMAKLIILLMTSNMRPTGYFTPCIISGNSIFFMSQVHACFMKKFSQDQRTV